MQLWLAIRVAWRVLFDRAAAERVEQAMEGKSAPAAPALPPPQLETKPVEASKPGMRGEALTLLATLQREARFLDLVQEPLGEYTDEQVGAAARDVLRQCAGALQRLFALQPVVTEEEGSVVEVPRGYDPLRFRLVGKVAGEPPFRGKLMHRGWQVTRQDLPVWSGSSQSAQVIAPVEVEVG